MLVPSVVLQLHVVNKNRMAIFDYYEPRLRRGFESFGAFATTEERTHAHQLFLFSTYRGYSSARSVTNRTVSARTEIELHARINREDCDVRMIGEIGSLGCKVQAHDGQRPARNCTCTFPESHTRPLACGPLCSFLNLPHPVSMKFSLSSLLIALLASTTRASSMVSQQASSTCKLTGNYVDSTSINSPNCKSILISNLHVPKEYHPRLDQGASGSTITFAGTTTFDVTVCTRMQTIDRISVMLSAVVETIRAYVTLPVSAALSVARSLSLSLTHTLTNAFDMNGSFFLRIGIGLERTARAALRKQTPITGSGVLDGQGDSYWKQFKANPNFKRPVFFRLLNVHSSTLSNFKILNSPFRTFSIVDSTDTVLDHLTLDSSAGDGLAKNTDGFDLSSNNGVNITNNNILNQDDCLAMQSSTNTHFIGNTCTGGHGISVGSIGGNAVDDTDTVSGLVVQNNKIVNSDNGIRIKTIVGSQGLVTGVTYIGNILMNVKNAIVMHSDYSKSAGGYTGKATSAVAIKDITIDGLSGTATNLYDVFVNPNAVSGWKWSGITVKATAKGSCSGQPSTVTCA
ncbi:Polygalacturonase, partial [Globisporangium splendens]